MITQNQLEGLQFQHKDGGMIYTITDVNSSSCTLRWRGKGDKEEHKATYLIKDVLDYFQKGTWIPEKVQVNNNLSYEIY